MQHHGIGPLDKWVNDHIFIRIRKEYFTKYNTACAQWHQEILTNGNIKQTGGRPWFPGKLMQAGLTKEFNESCTYQIKDLSDSSPCTEHYALFSYNLADIDTFSEYLGIPWEQSKDQPFASSTVYIGFLWDLNQKDVSLALAKVTKYLEAIQEWQRQTTHVLSDVKQLYGKLFHASAALPRGCKVSLPISTPPSLTDLQAFSDASSGMDIGIVIGSKWRAWHLCPGWQHKHGSSRDIGWAEAISFELLVCTVNAILNNNTSFIAFGNNTSVVKGW
ncbi:hypothetical protein ID866_9212, partial [Astraeus odoratus]